MARKLFHVEIKGTKSHHYFGSISAIFAQFTAEDLGRSQSFFQKLDWEMNPVYENEWVIIRPGELLSAGDIKLRHFPRV